MKDRKLAEEILLSKFPLLPAKSNKEGMDRIVLAMEEYHQQKLRPPTDEEMLNACPQEYKPRLAAWMQGARWMCEKLTGKSEEKQKGVTPPFVTDEEIRISTWQFKHIEDTLRMTYNIHHSGSRETCFDRCVCKSYKFAKDALLHLQPVGKTDKLPGEQGAPFDEEIK